MHVWVPFDFLILFPTTINFALQLYFDFILTQFQYSDVFVFRFIMYRYPLKSICNFPRRLAVYSRIPNMIKYFTSFYVTDILIKRDIKKHTAIQFRRKSFNLGRTWHLDKDLLNIHWAFRVSFQLWFVLALHILVLLPIVFYV